MNANPFAQALAHAGMTPQAVSGVEQNGYGHRRPLTATACDTVRTQLAGGFLPTLAMHAELAPTEEVYRKLPASGMFTATPAKPYILELGSFTVPSNMVLLLLDWRYDIYRPDPVMVGNVLPIPDRSLALSIGWDIQFNSQRPGNVKYQIAPAFPSASQAAYIANPNAGIIMGAGAPGPASAPQVDFDNARAAALQSTTMGLGMQPQRHRRDVQPDMPFTYILEPTHRLVLRAIIFQPVPIPLSFFEAEFSGILTGANAFKNFMKQVTLCNEPIR